MNSDAEQMIQDLQLQIYELQSRLNNVESNVTTIENAVDAASSIQGEQPRIIGSNGINVQQMGDSIIVSGLPTLDDDDVNFSYSVSGNQATVKGGHWRIRGRGKETVADATLTLTGSPAWVRVRKLISGDIDDGNLSIGFQNTEPDDADGTYHYATLCKCVPTAGVYAITEYCRGKNVGDIVESNPL